MVFDGEPYLRDRQHNHSALLTHTPDFTDSCANIGNVFEHLEAGDEIEGRIGESQSLCGHTECLDSAEAIDVLAKFTQTRLFHVDARGLVKLRRDQFGDEAIAAAYIKIAGPAHVARDGACELQRETSKFSSGAMSMAGRRTAEDGNVLNMHGARTAPKRIPLGRRAIPVT